MKKLLTLALIALLISTSATQAMSAAARRIASTARRTLPIFVRQCSTHNPHETMPPLATSAAALAAITATGGTVFACGCFGFDLFDEEAIEERERKEEKEYLAQERENFKKCRDYIHGKGHRRGKL